MVMRYSPRRLAQIRATRNRLNEMGEPTHYYVDTAHDTIPGNSSKRNKNRIRTRNRCNAILAAYRCAVVEHKPLSSRALDRLAYDMGGLHLTPKHYDKRRYH
jgi:hypothetical protein